MKAPRADQLALIKVADLDAQIARLEAKNTKHPLRADLGTLMNIIAAKSYERTQNEGRLTEAHEDLDAREAATATIRTDVESKEKQYNSGEGLTSKGLLALAEEIKAARAKLDEASEDEFAALEEVDYREQRAATLEREMKDLNESMLAKRSELEDAVAEIEGEADKLRAERDALLEPIAGELRNAYEHARTTGGYTVIAMAPSGATNAGVSFSPVEVARIKNAPEDEVLLSEDYDAVIVRVDHL